MFVAIKQQSIFLRRILRTNKIWKSLTNQNSVIYHAQREHAASIGRYQQTRTCLLQRYRLQGLQRSSRVRVR